MVEVKCQVCKKSPAGMVRWPEEDGEYICAPCLRKQFSEWSFRLIKREMKFLDQPLEKVQANTADLDLVKGLEAFAALVLREISSRYPEFPELSDEEEAGMSEEAIAAWVHAREPLDDLHVFIRRVARFSEGVRQQLEQRVFTR